MRIRKEERNTAHGPMDEPYFALKYLGSTSYAGKTCSCMHVFVQTAGNYQAWMHYTHADCKKPSVHEREIVAKAMATANPPRAISSFFNTLPTRRRRLRLNPLSTHRPRSMMMLRQQRGTMVKIFFKCLAQFAMNNADVCNFVGVFLYHSTTFVYHSITCHE